MDVISGPRTPHPCHRPPSGDVAISVQFFFYLYNFCSITVLPSYLRHLALQKVLYDDDAAATRPKRQLLDTQYATSSLENHIYRMAILKQLSLQAVSPLLYCLHVFRSVSAQISRVICPRFIRTCRHRTGLFQRLLARFIADFIAEIFIAIKNMRGHHHVPPFPPRRIRVSINRSRPASSKRSTRLSAFRSRYNEE